MKNLNIKFIALFLAGTAIIGCDDEFDNAIEDGGVYTSGEADFSKFVTLGNSLTAGFADNALYLSGQLNSYPNIIAGQMQFAGGGEFNQPLVNDNAGGLLFNGAIIPNSEGVNRFPNRLVLASDGMGVPAGPIVLPNETLTATTDVANKVTGPLNNFGVAGAKSFHLAFEGYGSTAGVLTGQSNPYFTRFASSENASMIGDAVAANGTFFTLWIGNNDILSYATNGGTVTNPLTGEITPALDHNETMNFVPSTYGSSDITNNNVFAGVYQQLVDGLTANGAKGALVNIPDVTSIPFFTTVPFAPLSPANPSFGSQIPTLNATFAGLNQAFAFLGVPERSITFSETAASAVVINDKSLTDLSAQLTQVLIGGGLDAATATLFGQQFGQARQANATDLLTFTSQTVIGELNAARFDQLTGAGLDPATAGQLSINGVTFPLEDQWVLVQDEQDRITAAQTAYNATIEAIAIANDLAYVDVRTELSRVATSGISYNGGVLTSTYASGGAFSLDGVHPTARGYAFTANTIIDAINAKYDSTLPKVDIGAYDSIQLSDSAQ